MNFRFRNSESFSFQPTLNLCDKITEMLSIKSNANFRYFRQFFSEYIEGSSSIYPWKPSPSCNKYYYDFHCHTQYSDGAPTHDEIIQFLSRANHLSGFCTSDHLFHIQILNDGSHKRESNEKVIHQSYALLDKINHAKQTNKITRELLFIPGSVEFGIRVDSKDKKTAIEFIGLGLPKDFMERNGGLQKIKDTPAIDLIEKIHDDGGIAIFVHPFYFNQGLKYPEIWKRCDAVEQFNHTNYFWADSAIIPYFARFRDPIMLHRLFLLFLYFNWSGEAVISQLKKSGTGSSDAHILSFYGAGATAFDKKYDTFDELVSAIKKGRGTPCLNPLWRPTFSEPDPIQQMYNKWGRDFNNTIEKIHRNGPLLYSCLLGLSKIFGFFERLHNSRVRNQHKPK